MSGIYIHIPFCKQACYYCDFHFSTSLSKKDEMLMALQRELQLRAMEMEGETIETIYFGGGTPSLLATDEIQWLLDEVYTLYKIIPDPEVTLEANPDDLTSEKIKQLSHTPVNRLSIGIQSFFEDDLKAMNRAHSANEAKTCLEISKPYFNNITIDLIYGIPNMSLNKWEANLETAFGFEVPHISSYALTVEPKTALENFIRRGKYPPVNETLALQHFERLIEATKAQGYVQYEVSNFGKCGFESKHNTSYWQGKHYLGIGPSAHSFNGQQRSWNIANNVKYIKSLQKGIVPQEIETLTVKNRYNEYIMTGLRTIWGLSLNHVANEFGDDYKEMLVKVSQKFMTEGLLELTSKRDDRIITVTNKGKFLTDGIAAELFMI